MVENTTCSNVWEVEVSGSHHVYVLKYLHSFAFLCCVGVWMMYAYREQMLISIHEYNLPSLE